MFETFGTEDLTASEVLDRVRTQRDLELRAGAEQLVLAARWADLHPVADGQPAAGFGDADLHGEGLVPLAGVGTPLVAEFAPIELGAVLGITSTAAKALIGQALELRHRMPRLWDLVHAGRVPAWRARKIAGLTTDLCLDAACFRRPAGLCRPLPDRAGQRRSAGRGGPVVLRPRPGR